MSATGRLNYFRIFAVDSLISQYSVMVQNLIIGLLFLAAVGYLGYIVYQSFQIRSGCPSGCGSCGIDFDKIRKELAKKAAK